MITPIPNYLQEEDENEVEVDRFDVRPVSIEELSGQPTEIEEEEVERLDIRPTEIEDVPRAERRSSLQEISPESWPPMSDLHLRPYGLELVGPYLLDEARERDRLRKQRAQVIRDYGAIEFDEDRSFPDFGLSWSLFNNRTFEAKEKKFLATYPDGDIMQITFPKQRPQAEEDLLIQVEIRRQHPVARMDVPRSRYVSPARAAYIEEVSPLQPKDFESTIVARRNPDEPFREIWGGTGLVHALTSPEAITSMIMGWRHGAWGSATGWLAGSLGNAIAQQTQGYEYLEGYTSEDLQKALQEAAVVGLFDAATRATLRRFGYSSKAIDTLDAVETWGQLEFSARQMGLPPFPGQDTFFPPVMRGQVGNDLTRAAYRQSAMLSGNLVETKMSDTQRAMFRYLTANVENVPFEALSDTTLNQIAQNQLRGIANLPRPVGPRDRVNFGLTLRNAVETYTKANQNMFARRYANLSNLADDLGGNLSWDLTSPVYRTNLLTGEASAPVSIKELAQQGLRGTVGRGSPEYTARTGQQTVSNLAGELSPDLRRAYQKVIDLDDTITLTNVADSPFQQIKDLRTNFFAIKESASLPDWQRAQADRMYSALTELIENPNVIANRAEDITRLTSEFRLISGDYALYKESLKMPLIKSAILTEPPEAIARQLLKAGNGSQWQQLKKYLSPEEYNRLRDYAYSDLANIDSSITMLEGVIPADGNQRLANANYAIRRLNTLARNDPILLREIMSPAEEDALRRYLITARNYATEPWAAVTESALSASDRALQIVRNSTADQLRSFINASGGMDSANGYALRAAVYRDIIESSTTTSQHYGDVVDLNQVFQNIERWKGTKKLDALFVGADWQQLNNIRNHSFVVSGLGNPSIGGGLQRGQVLANVAQSPTELASGNYAKVLKGVVKPIISARLLALMLATPANKNMVTQIPKTSENLISSATAVLIQGHKNINRFYGTDVDEDQLSKQITRLGGDRTIAP